MEFSLLSRFGRTGCLLARLAPGLPVSVFRSGTKGRLCGGGQNLNVICFQFVSCTLSIIGGSGFQQRLGSGLVRTTFLVEKEGKRNLNLDTCIW